MSTTSDHFFLVIEGMDGSGKTTIARHLAQSLQALDDAVYLTFEPHDASAAGLFIRQALVGKITVPPKALALAFALNRLDHSTNVIEPCLAVKGKKPVVICDRYYLSSLVYQSSAELSMEEVMLFNEGVRVPDLTIFLDASINTCFKRMRKRSAVSEEKRDRELFEKRLDITREKYEQGIAFLRARGEKIEMVDANSDRMSDIMDSIMITLAEHGPGWLKPQLSLFEEKAEDTSDAFSFNGEVEERNTLSALVEELGEVWMKEPPASLAQVEAFRSGIHDAVADRVQEMAVDDLGLLFLACVQSAGYSIVGRMPWTDLSAYELEATLPLQLKQRGTALLLGTQYSHDVITNKILSEKLVLDSVSDFMLVLDPGSSKMAGSYWREVIMNSTKQGALSPATCIIGRDDLTQFVYGEVITLYERKYSKSLESIPEAIDLVASFRVSSLTGQKGSGPG